MQILHFWLSWTGCGAKAGFGSQRPAVPFSLVTRRLSVLGCTPTAACAYGPGVRRVSARIEDCDRHRWHSALGMMGLSTLSVHCRPVRGGLMPALFRRPRTISVVSFGVFSFLLSFFPPGGSARYAD